ncbi:protein timeless isoform X2 [Daktulosphaira vitifoliae]|uniref:protein timeless isoform X2 n=1 Tax=Daktulosphaira vitifoliae TaxID=58002 RepID=UPI0021AA6C87|nr:protein timeless isoform X2 [Daktulosphaira vitifoliae]
MDMTRYLGNPHVQNMFAQLGMFVGNDYIPSNKCYSILLQIHEQLISEDPCQRSFRMTIGFSQLVQKDLIPLLINVENEKILELLVKILSNIMMPIECLIPTNHLIKNEADRATIIKLSWLLTSGKTAFVDKKVIKRIIQLIRDNSVKIYNSQVYSSYFEVIDDCLRLLKNVLHVPNNQSQNQILWMLFSEKFDEILINLIANINRGQWAMLIIELLALIYKNQHVDQMAQQLSKWNETMISDSSEDNESNTSSSPPNNGANSIQINTSTESSTSDDYDSDHLVNTIKDSEEAMDTQYIDINDVKSQSVFKEPVSVRVDWEQLNNHKKNKLNPHANEEISSIKPSEVVVNQNNNAYNKISDPQPLFNSNKKSKTRMKKVTKKSKLNVVRVSPAIGLTPTEDQISHLLQKFTIHFLRNGFNTLIIEVYNQLNSNAHHHIDTSLYFWLLTYFCRFCKIVEIDLKIVRKIVSFQLISFMAHEGLKVLEHLMVAKRQKAHDIHLPVRHLHLVVMAIKEVIKTIEYYRQSVVGLSSIYEDFINNLKIDLKNSGFNSPDSISWAQDFKSLFALLIRHYDKDIQTIEYLQDLITTNHMVLIFFDNIKHFCNLKESIRAHVKKFAAPDIMLNYGLVLKNFITNDEFVNEAILTMMHHIVGEVENTTVLYQPLILKSFLQIMEKKDELYERWSDLIEYAIHKFLSLSQSHDPLLTLNKSLNSRERSEIFNWTKQEQNALLVYYLECTTHDDPIGKVVKMYADSGSIRKTKSSVLEQLLQQDIINEEQYNKYKQEIQEIIINWLLRRYGQLKNYLASKSVN